jgi:O-antigen ligase
MNFPPLFARFSLLCTILLCTLPFLQPYHLYPLTTFYSEWLAFALGLGVMTVWMDGRLQERAGIPWVALSPFALAVLLMVHGLLGWSPYFGQALAGALYLAWAGLLIMAGRSLARLWGVETLSLVIASALAAGALLSAAAGLIQFYGLKTPLNAWIARPTSIALFGNLAQANHFASHATLGLLSLAYLSLRGRRTAMIALPCTLPLLFVLGLSGSRSVWLFMLAALALAGVWRALHRDDANKRLFMVTGGLVIVYFLMQVVVQAGWVRSPAQDALTAVDRLFGSPGSVIDRFSLWRASWTLLLAHPLNGVGWGAFASAYYQQITAIDADKLFNLYHNSHNIVLHLLAETGLIGGLLLAVPMVIWAFHALRTPRNSQLWWLLALTGVFAVHSLLEYPLWYAYFLGIAALLLGIVETPALPMRRIRLLALLLLLAGGFNLATLWTDYRTFERLFNPSPGQLPPANLVEQMISLHRDPLLIPYVETATAVGLSLDETGYRQQLFINSRVLRFSPQPRLVYRQALLLALADRPQEAREQLLRARRAYLEPPGFAADLERLARIHPEQMQALLESAPRRTRTSP